MLFEVCTVFRSGLRGERREKMVGGEGYEKEEIVIKKRDARRQSNTKDREKGKERKRE